MPQPTFPNILPDRSSKRSIKDRVLMANFGDGYAQAVRDGINTREEIWSLSFKDYPESQINTIETFLTDLGSTEFFYWTPPGEGSPKKWIQTGDMSFGFPGHNTKSLNVDIKRVYTLGS